MELKSHPMCEGVTLSKIDCECYQPEEMKCADKVGIVRVFVMRPVVEPVPKMFLPPQPRPWERRKKGQKR